MKRKENGVEKKKIGNRKNDTKYVTFLKYALLFQESKNKSETKKKNVSKLNHTISYYKFPKICGSRVIKNDCKHIETLYESN